MKRDEYGIPLRTDGRIKPRNAREVTFEVTEEDIQKACSLVGTRWYDVCYHDPISQAFRRNYYREGFRCTGDKTLSTDTDEWEIMRGRSILRDWCLTGTAEPGTVVLRRKEE